MILCPALTLPLALGSGALPILDIVNLYTIFFGICLYKQYMTFYYALTCFQDDSETESLKSEISELCLLKQKLDYQVSQLQTKVETYERDIECFEMVSSFISLGSEGILNT
jgi:uncharacterized protein YlxW (UPF0749 family)